MIPTTEPARRISLLFNRRLTTPWSEAEVREYRKLYKAGCFNSLDDLNLIERYYASERKKGNDGYHRRDVLRLLRYWNGEVDRAKGCKEKIKRTPRGYGQLNGRAQGSATDEDFKVAGAEAKKMIESLRASLRPQQKLL